MSKKSHISETPATALLKANGIEFTEHPYEYLEHGGANHSAEVLGQDPWIVVKTLIMQDDATKPLVVLMHGNRKVSTKNLARQIGRKSVAFGLFGGWHVAVWHQARDAGLYRANDS
jgi:Cys-tRNA(Pro) deacylase